MGSLGHSVFKLSQAPVGVNAITTYFVSTPLLPRIHQNLRRSWSSGSLAMAEWTTYGRHGRISGRYQIKVKYLQQLQGDHSRLNGAAYVSDPLRDISQQSLH